MGCAGVSETQLLAELVPRGVEWLWDLRLGRALPLWLGFGCLDEERTLNPKLKTPNPKPFSLYYPYKEEIF